MKNKCFINQIITLGFFIILPIKEGGVPLKKEPGSDPADCKNDRFKVTYRPARMIYFLIASILKPWTKSSRS
ncbi:MAG TPA: hypothetical protein VGK38_01595 [Prolixibacteraceae bacterium]